VCPFEISSSCASSRSFSVHTSLPNSLEAKSLVSFCIFRHSILLFPGEFTKLGRVVVEIKLSFGLHVYKNRLDESSSEGSWTDLNGLAQSVQNSSSLSEGHMNYESFMRLRKGLGKSATGE
jgi:hypothetical protein